jgi:hypothetical protein
MLPRVMSIVKLAWPRFQIYEIVRLFLVKGVVDLHLAFLTQTSSFVPHCPLDFRCSTKYVTKGCPSLHINSDTSCLRPVFLICYNYKRTLTGVPLFKSSAVVAISAA